MVDDPLAELSSLPDHGIARITVQCDGRDDLADLVRHSRSRAREVSLAVQDAGVRYAVVGRALTPASTVR